MRHANARVARSTESAIRLMHRHNVRILCSIFVGNGKAAIGGAIVNKNDFEIGRRQILRQQAIDATVQIRRDIINRDDYTEFHRKIPHFSSLKTTRSTNHTMPQR